MSAPSNAAALILNGGRARRMDGADKSRIQIEGKSIVHRQCEVLFKRFNAVAMVGAAVDLPTDLSLHALEDRVGGKGPVDGIASGLAWSPEPWLFVVASDMPFLNLDLIDALLAARDDRSDIVCVDTGSRAQPLFALYHRKLLPTLDRRLSEGLLRASELIEAPPDGLSVARLSEAEARKIDPELQSFRNFNSLEDVLTSGASIE
jgi:molybdopterin-guanine dinucleotide biosynthesis protein A